MTTPTLSTAGTNSELLLITCNSGVEHRINKPQLCEVVDSTTATIFRVNIFHGIRELSLEFASQTEVNTFLTALDGEY